MKNQIRKTAFIASILFASFAITSCDDDDETPMAEETPEVITQVKLTFTPTTGAVVTSSATSVDGEVAFVLNPDSIELQQNTDYTLSVEFINQLENPDENITEEIKEEAGEHQLFFSSTGGVFTIANGTYADKEGDYSECKECVTTNTNKPVGLKTTWKTSSVTSIGSLKVQLKHQPDGQKNGSPTSGEDDVNLNFPIKVTPVVEETPKVITQVGLNFSGANVNPVNAKATDADGDGQGFVFDPGTIELKADSTYTLDLTFTNQLEDPDEDITAEIREEADEHQVFFTATNSVVTVTYADDESDYVTNGCVGCTGSTRDVGLKTSVKVNGTVGTTGTMTVRLKHQPDGIKTDNSTANDGEDDVNLTFNVKVI